MDVYTLVTDILAVCLDLKGFFEPAYGAGGHALLHWNISLVLKYYPKTTI